MAHSQVYQKKTQREHILLRPDTYIGSVAKQHTDAWVFDRRSRTIVWKAVSYVPGLYKLFDELFVNAADNRCVSLVDAFGTSFC
jgi:DNA topoisomerase-2